MIKVTIDNLLAVKPILQEIATTPMTAKNSFAVLRMLKNIDKEFEAIEATQRQLVETYAMRDENGQYEMTEQGGIKINPEKFGEYVSEANQFVATELEIDAKPLAWEIVENLTLTPSQMMQMEAFIEVVEE